MPDREKVVKGLETIKQFFGFGLPSTAEMFDSYYGILSDAIALLKEQEKTKVVFGRTKDGEFVTECGNCGSHLDKAYSNCPKCKKELDWNSNQI